MLNQDQRRVLGPLTSDIPRNCECLCDLKPLRVFVSGVGGTRKSFFIEADSDDLLRTDWAKWQLHSARAAGYWALPKQSRKT